MLCIIRNIPYFVNKSDMITLYYALLYPHLIYTGLSYVSNLNSIYLIQKKILKK